VFLLVAVAPGATAVWAATRAADVLDGRPVTSTTPWVPGLGLTLDLRLDALAFCS
jgi:multicomponent Na+:H+ antiporter subunit A